MPSKLNTHYYDGKLKERYQELQQDNLASSLSISETLEEIRTLIKEVKHPQRVKLYRMLQKLQHDNQGNYDAKNQIHVKDLLPLVWAHVKDYEVGAQMLFLEQILDIYRGPCPQGRTTRLLQCVEILPKSQKNDSSQNNKV